MQGAITPLPRSDRKRTTSGNEYARNSKRVRVREKRWRRCVSWRTETYNAFLGRCCVPTARVRWVLVCWRLVDSAGGCFFLTPIWIFYFYLVTKGRKRNSHR